MKKARIFNDNIGCPVCGNEAIGGMGINVEGILTIREMYCMDCDTSWHDVYRLVDKIIHEYDGE